MNKINEDPRVTLKKCEIYYRINTKQHLFNVMLQFRTQQCNCSVTRLAYDYICGYRVRNYNIDIKLPLVYTFTD